MIRSKYFGLAAVAFAMLSLGACTTDSDSTVPTIDGLYLDNTALTAGGTATAIHTTVSGDAGFQVLFSIQDASGKDASSYFTLNQGTGPKSTDTKWQSIDNGSTIAAKSTAVNGTYTLTLTVTSSSGNNTKTAAFTVTGGTNSSSGTAIVNVGSITVGSQASSASSFISLQDTTVENSTSAASEPELIDLIYFFNAAGDTAFFYSPSEAFAEGLGKSSVQTWATRNSTKIFKTSKASFATTADVATEIAANSGSGVKAQVVDGGMYVVQYNGTHYAVVKVSGTPEATKATSSISVTLYE